MTEVAIIFPHQLFYKNPAVKPGRISYLVEESLFFTQYNFHQQKILLHRASMKSYEEYLKDKKYEVVYIDSKEKNADIRNLIKTLAAEKITQVHFTEPVDNWLKKRILQSCKKYAIETTIHTTPAFLNNMQEANQYFDNKNSYFQTGFYVDQRKKRKMLTTAAMEPVGGRWSYDADNRLKFPAKQPAPFIEKIAINRFSKEAKEYVRKNFSKNYGDTTNFNYPVNFKEAQQWLDDFISHRLEKFGIYEDAIVANEHWLHHSVLSPLINIGLLTPQQVIDQVIQSAKRFHTPINSLEGFIRQIIGWREFIRIVYEREGSKQRTTNFWGFDRKIPASFWNGSTGIAPVDHTIQKIIKTGYCHHIERLMVLGNFMLLCEFDPDEVYRWFMELFIDSYDWVMVPNVYGMTQFADGGLMTTKPYISGSIYILKMSDYKKGDWCKTWDALFWRFMHVNRDVLSKNHRLGVLFKTLDKMSDEKKEHYFLTAEKFLTSL